MIQLIQYGYLETPYLSEFPYLQPANEQGLAAQTTLTVIDEHDVGVQFLGDITKDTPFATQFEGFAEDKERDLALQSNLTVIAESAVALQTFIENTKDNSKAIQSLFNIENDKVTGLQFKAFNTKDDATGFQALRVFNGKESIKGAQFRQSDSLAHISCNEGGYLNEEPYLSTYQYLAPFFCVPMGIQFESVQEGLKAFQFRSAFYNTTNLRILVDFPSRGLTGSNWTSTSTQSSSTNSFTVNNLNTDIVEQYWRSQTGTLSATLTCDTQLTQGVYLDTLAILNHNLSGSATVTLQGSNDSGFITTPVNIAISYEQVNMYYIAPTLPLESYRYWRLIVSDPGSADNFLRIGTVVFGSAVIFSNESFVDRVQFGQRQFVDSVYTEGFTNISNDRGKKKYLSLDFKNLSYNKRNFQNMRDIFDYAGSTLKCLWIPTPEAASRFAVFAKMSEIPSESHNYKGASADYVDFSISLDESL